MNATHLNRKLATVPVPYDHTPADDTMGLRRLIFALQSPPTEIEQLMERIDLSDIVAQVDDLLERVR